MQTCFIHLIRRTFQYASSKYWDELSKDLKPIYQAADAEAAAAALDDLVPDVGASGIARWSGCGATPGMSSFPFLDCDVEIRTVICSTNAIKSLNARSEGRSRHAGNSRASRPR